MFSERAAGPCGFSSVLMLLLSIMTEIKIIYLSTQLQNIPEAFSWKELIFEVDQCNLCVATALMTADTKAFSQGQ